MKIVVMSDSHGRNKAIDEVIELNKDADMFLHCGDIESDEFLFPDLRTVTGNNDIYYDYPEQLVINAKNHRILVTHSHQCYFRNRMNYLVQKAKEYHCDIVCYGHTHVAARDVQDGILLINPGSLRYSRDGKNPSYAILTIDEGVSVHFEFEPFDKK